MPSIYTDFTKRDYTANFERLLTLLSTEVPTLTDRNHSDTGISILRLLARQTDMLSFYIDEVFIEGFVSTANFKQSLIDLGTLVDCRPKLASPASTTVTVTKKTPPFGEPEPSVSIPAFSQFSRADGISYINMEAVSLPVGTASATFQVLQLEQIELSLEASDFTMFGLFKRLSYNLGTNVVSGYVTFLDVLGEITWTEVDSFYRSMPDDTHYMLELYADLYEDEQDTVFLSIGDGVYGNGTPPGTISIIYHTTSGASGNCGAGTIVYAPAGLTDLITVTNTVSATGGAAAEGKEQFRQRLPMVVQSQRRGLTERDYDALVRSIPGVLYCQATSRSSNTSWPFLYIFLYVLPEGGGAVSEYLEGVIIEQCKEWGHFGDWAGRYIILDAVENEVDVTMSVGKLTGYQQQTVDTAIRAAIDTFFLPENRLVGVNLNFSDLHSTVSLVPGVDWVEFDSPESTLVASEGDTFVLGTVSITYA